MTTQEKVGLLRKDILRREGENYTSASRDGRLGWEKGLSDGDAYGTRAEDIIVRYGKGTDRVRRHGTVFNGTFPYFDLVRRDWRCFRVDSLLEMDRDYVV